MTQLESRSLANLQEVWSLLRTCGILLSIAAASVEYYNYAWTLDPIVSGFITESSSATGFGTSAPPNNTAAWFSASQKLDCGGPSDGIPASVACMRTKKFEDILDAIVTPAGPLDIVGPFPPTADNKVVFDDYSARASAGNFIKKPYLTGNNDYEAGLFKYTATTFYGIELSALDWALFNLGIFSCPAGSAAAQRSQHGVPTWRYRYYGEFENLRLTDSPNSGAYHASEIYTIWQTSEDCGLANNTAVETEISKYLQGAWAAFAKDPEGGLSGGPYNWPRYDTSGRWYPFSSGCNYSLLTVPEKTLIRLGYNDEMTASYECPSTYDLACAALERALTATPGGVSGLIGDPNSSGLKSLSQFTNLTAMGGGSDINYWEIRSWVGLTWLGPGTDVASKNRTDRVLMDNCLRW